MTNWQYTKTEFYHYPEKTTFPGGIYQPGLSWPSVQRDKASQALSVSASPSPHKNGMGNSMYFKYKAVHSLLQQSQSIELKYSLRYFPKGQTEHFSKAIPEPLVLPKPTRSQAPFKAENQPWIEQTFRLNAPRPVDQIPLDKPGEPAIHLITGQPTG